MRKIYIADSLIDGQLLIDYLSENGVPAALFHQNSQGGLGELAVTYPEVWIKRDTDANKAQNLIHQFENRPSPVTNLYCSQCEEPNPGSFEICWKCRTPLDLSSA